MNPVQEFFLKAQNAGAAQQVRELEMKLLKAENENKELRAALAEMQRFKDRYQLVVIDLMAVLERHGLVQ